MPRPKSQIANKDYPEHGIKKGERYWKWKFRYGGKHMSATPPKPSQLTQREDHGAILRAQEINPPEWDAENREEIADSINDMLAELESGKDAAQEKYDNLPENFQQAEQGQNLETLVSECEDCMTELENIRDELQDKDHEFDSIDNLESISWPSV
jgi:hypothetical protein